MSTEPITPYAGTSGWSGSATSEERAKTQDANGTTSQRQRETLVLVAVRGEQGVTVADLRVMTGWHHGQSSSALSVLHKEGLLARLTERRHRCAVYVLPEHVASRETAPHGRQRPDGLTPLERIHLGRLQKVIADADDLGVSMTYVPTDALTHVIAAVERLR